MVTGPESRILARLHTFSSTLESAWDVPRDICLPGLSEYLGVVRSALHSPLNELVKKGMVIERKAHVIGGGSRKRKVYRECDAIGIGIKGDLAAIVVIHADDGVIKGQESWPLIHRGDEGDSISLPKVLKKWSVE